MRGAAPAIRGETRCRSADSGSLRRGFRVARGAEAPDASSGPGKRARDAPDRTGPATHRLAGRVDVLLYALTRLDVTGHVRLASVSGSAGRDRCRRVLDSDADPLLRTRGDVFDSKGLTNSL